MASSSSAVVVVVVLVFRGSKGAHDADDVRDMSRDIDIQKHHRFFVASPSLQSTLLLNKHLRMIR